MPSEGLPAQRIAHVLHAGFVEATVGSIRRRDHADLIDAWLRDRWDDAAGPSRGVALAAVGSLGRRDLGPASDLDLVLLYSAGEPTHAHPSAIPAYVSALASALWYPIWDCGTSLDHSVRTPQGCVSVAQEDLRAAIGMLDLRHIAGDAQLVETTATQVRHQWRRGARRRVGELLELAEDRTGRYGPLAHSSEPNLSADRGGLRDVVVIRALAESWLADYDHDAVNAAASTLADARDALQAVTGRSSTRLSRADQDAVAALTGYSHADDLLAALGDAARVISWELDRTSRAAVKAAERGSPGTRGSGTNRRPRIERHDHGVLVQAEEISTDPTSTDPLRDIAAFALSATTGKPLAQATLKRLALAGPLPPLGPSHRDLFIEGLAGEHFLSTYEDLDVHGVMATWIPGWEHIRNRPQRSTVHRFTVDRHLAETVVEAQAFLKHVDRPDLLLMTALVHDLGKRAGARDHSREGAPLAATAASHLGFEPDDVRRISRLVEHHLTLIELATGRDHADPATLATLLEAVDHDRSQLEILRALTEADARAAGPAAWTQWRESLVDHLTNAARDQLSGFSRRPKDLLTPQKDARRRVMEAARSTGSAHVIYPAPDGPEDITQVCTAAPDALGVFAAMTRALVRHRLDVRSAVVESIGGLAVNTWWVTGPPTSLPHPTVLRAALDREIARRLDPAARLHEIRPGAPARTSEDTPVVTVLTQASHDATVIQVNARNRPSLLSDIADEITDHQLVLRSAHVMTLGSRAVDVLYLVDKKGRPLDPPGTARIIAGLMDAAGS